MLQVVLVQQAQSVPQARLAQRVQSVPQVQLSHKVQQVHRVLQAQQDRAVGIAMAMAVQMIMKISIATGL